jgi:hypothetical protein
MAAESVVRHYKVLMNNWDCSVGRRRFDGAVSRWPGKDEVSEERACDAGDHDPDHGYGGGGATGAGERGGGGHRHCLGDAEDRGGGTGDVRGFGGGECIGVAEDERLNRHQDEEPGAGEQQRGVEGEYGHGQGRDGERGEGKPEPDQGARLTRVRTRWQ